MKWNKWKNEEIEFLKTNYREKGSFYCAEKLNRTVAIIRCKASQLGINKIKMRKWSHEEMEFLYQNYVTKGVRYCAEKLSRKPSNVNGKARSLGLRIDSDPWTDEDFKFLKEHYPLKGAIYCAKQLGCSVGLIRQVLSKLKIVSGSRYTEAEIQFLKDNYPSKGKPYCANHLNRTLDSVTTKAGSLGLIITNRRHPESLKRHNIKAKIAHFKRKDKEIDPNLTFENLMTKIGEKPTCYLTGTPINLEKSSSYSLDHIIPVSRGGKSTLENCGLATLDANISKKSMTEREFIDFCFAVCQFQQSKNNPI